MNSAQFLQCYNSIMPGAEFEELSERELEILKLLATGASNKEIAKQLIISPNTVKVHIRNIFSKIGAGSRTEAALFAIRAGFIPSHTTFVANPTEQKPIYKIDSTISWVRKRRWIIALPILFILLSVPLLRNINRRNITIPDTTPTPVNIFWQEIALMPTARKNFAVAVHDDQIFTIGGEASSGIVSTVEVYDLKQDLWRNAAPKPNPVTDTQAVLIGNKIYVPGGKDQENKPRDFLDIYDPQSNTWLMGFPIPIPLNGFGLLNLEGMLYILGGWGENGPAEAVFRYDPTIMEWKRLNDLPFPISNMAAVEVNNNIYLFGGWDGKKLYPYILRGKILGDNPDEIRWEISGELPEPAFGFRTAVLADYIFFAGGKRFGDETFTKATHWQYVPNADSWGTYPEMPLNGWSEMSLVGTGTNLYAMGGQKGNEIVNYNFTVQAITIISLPLIR
jgi:DNA-binding CsgD family transcriptional regulator